MKKKEKSEAKIVKDRKKGTTTIKPRHPHMEHLPDDNDPNAQYEDKDES